MDGYVFNLVDVNLGKITDNDFKESKSITLLKEVLEKNQKIKVRAEEADKIPDLDGSIRILDDLGHERIIVDIQSKTLPSEYNETNPYYYDCETKVFNVVKYKKTFNPVVLFLSDINNKKIYYKLVTNEYIEILDYGNQNCKRIKFNDNDLYEEKKFIKEIEKYVTKLTLIMKTGEKSLATSFVNGPNESYNLMQEEIDKVNNLFDGKLKMVKEHLFPHVWKFGIAYNKNGNGYVLGLYKIYKGQNDTLIKNFNVKDNNYFQTIFVSDVSYKTLEKSMNEFVGECINLFYNDYPLDPLYCDNNILCEIVFEFLDNITHLSEKIRNNDTRKYYKDEEDIENVRSIINGLTKFYKKIWAEKDKYPDVELLEPSYNVTKRFLLFNPLISFHQCQELLEKYIFEKDLSKFEANIFLNGRVNMSLVMRAIEELEKRKIKKINRLYKKEEDNYIKTVFNLLNDSYNFSAKKLELNSSQKINEHYIINYSAKDNYEYKLEKVDSVEDFIVECNLVNKNKLNGSLNDLKYFSRIVNPLYNLTRLLINKGCMEAQGLKFHFKSECLDLYGIKDFPIIENKETPKPKYV